MKPVGLQHNPSEELKPNHALDDSLLFIFSFCVVTKRALLSASFHFSFSFYPYDLFPIPSDAYCYCPTIFKNNLFSFEFFFFFFSQACKIAARISNLEFILLKPTPQFFSYIKDIVSFFFLLLHPCRFLRCFHPSLQLPPSPPFSPPPHHQSCKRIFEIMKWDNSTNYFPLAFLCVFIWCLSLLYLFHFLVLFFLFISFVISQ